MAAFIVALTAMGSVFHNIGHLLKKPKYRAVFIWLLLVILLGTVFYHYTEGWGWIDSLYFSVITLSTVGYGDFSPTTPFTKLFTTVYIFLGISIFAAFASMLARERVEISQERTTRKKQKTAED
jgi:voltage-gated potassium channel Kch